MFTGIQNGGQLVRSAMRALKKQPSLLLPMIACWSAYAPALVYVEFFFPWQDYGTAQRLGFVFLLVLFFSLILSLSCFALLSLVEQIETGQESSIIRSLFFSLTNVLKAFPIVLVWAIIWFVTLLVEILFRAAIPSETDTEFNAENVARTVAGIEGLSVSGAFFKVVRKGVRMVAFLIYPAIAWERNGLLLSVKRGLAVACVHKVEFATGFTLTELASVVVFLPAGIVCILPRYFHIPLPDVVWIAVIVYCCFAWSFSVFLEQMFAAELYRWHLRWEKACMAAHQDGRKLPDLDEIPRPSIMDTRPDLAIALVNLAKRNSSTKSLSNKAD